MAELVDRGRRRRYESDQTVFLQGDRAEGLHVVLSGRIKVFKLSPKGREQTLMIMGSGEPVGEVAVLSGEAYPASTETLEPSETLYIPRQAFLDLVSREPEVAMRLLSALSARLRSFASLIEDLSLRDVSEPETLSRAFQQLARTGAIETKGRKVLIKDRALLERVARAR